MPVKNFTAAADGAELVPAPSAFQFIRVIGGNLALSGAGTVSLKSNNSTVVMNGISPVQISVNPSVTLDCANGQSLNIGASAGTATGWVEYVVKGKPNADLLAGQ